MGSCNAKIICFLEWVMELHMRTFLLPVNISECGVPAFLTGCYTNIDTVWLYINILIQVDSNVIDTQSLAHSG